MNYFVECPRCGECYEIKQTIVPSCCSLCGCDTPKVTMGNTKARRRAREAMVKMDTLKPKILAARQAYMDLMVEYEAECQIVRSYARKGIVTPEEKDKYMIRKSESLRRVTLTQCMEEHWGKKR